MLKSRSVPGLMSLGTAMPKEGFQGRKTTLNFRLDGPVDNAPNAMPTSEKAATIAGLLKNPSWRWTSVDQPPRDNEPVDTAPSNMKWPRLSPAWLKHDKQVLRFYGFFQEHVVERWDENCRYRNVVFHYFMEDGTLSIFEPKIENSGIPQAQFLKRHQVPATEGGYVGPGHFRVGEDIEIYSITYHLTGCDRFTRWFYEENGIELAEDEPLVRDQWQKSYTFTKIAEKGGLPLSKSAVDAKTLTLFQVGQPPADRKLIQFLQNDRKVLRFKAYWDDETLYGNRVYFQIHYYLADNTCEVNEAHSRNSGRDSFPVFYKRAPLLKENRTNAYPGMLQPEPIPYLPKDFMVGGDPIIVWRRKVVLYDCDDFTRKFYKEYLGIDQWAGKIDVSEPPLRHQKLRPPPHLAPGSEEDSLQNVLMVQPKAPKQDLARLMTLSGELLRFEARMVNGEPEDENRRFILGYFPADHHVGAWELPVRNSGHMGGRFAEKKRVKNPDTGRYFELGEFAVGNTVTLSAQPFLIIRADEHTLRYLEGLPDEFPFADPGYCASLLAPLQNEPFMRDERGVDPDHLKAVAADHGVNLIDHEIITLLRNFNVTAEGGAPVISGPRILEFLQGGA